MRFLIGMIVLLAFAPFSLAVPGAGKLAGEFIEQMIRRYGDDAARQIADYGGEKAVRETIERAMREGGEELAKRLNRAGYTHGMSAFRAMSKNPRVYLNALDKVPPSLTKQAVYAIERNPDELAELLVKLGPEALEVSARHPGVGDIALKKLGDGAIPLARNLQEAQFIGATRYMDDIANLPQNARQTTLETLTKYPAQTLEFLNKQPNVLKYGTAAAVAIVYKEGVIETFQAGQEQIISTAGAALGVDTGPDGAPRPGKGTRWTFPVAVIILAFGLSVSWVVRARMSRSKPTMR